LTEGFGTAELIETDVLVDAKKLSQVLGSIGLVGSIVGAGLALWMFHPLLVEKLRAHVVI